MASKPTITKVVQIARSRQIVADQLVLGLVTGGLLGAGFVIDRRESHCIQFSKIAKHLSRSPDRGEIVLSEASPGETALECRLWCTGMSLRRLIISTLMGVMVATMAALLFGWLIHWTIPTGLGVAVIHDLTARWQDRSTIERQIDGFVRNITYLKSM
jgi:hypothetical protein